MIFITHFILLRQKKRVYRLKSKFKYRNLYLPRFDFYKELKSVRLEHLTSIYIYCSFIGFFCPGFMGVVLDKMIGIFNGSTSVILTLQCMYRWVPLYFVYNKSDETPSNTSCQVH